jgi:hypothetical protein
MTSLRISL